ncbi:MAG: right-handed parallel beta-helix repeat-containing protein [Bdellovibrionota bacterium]
MKISKTLFSILALGLLITSCMSPTLVAPTKRTSANSTLASSMSCPDTVISVVEELYSVAPDWNDYVRTSNTTLACDTTATTGGIHTCIHGGERRRVTLTGITSCTGLTATDDLGAFDWICIEPGGATDAYVMSTRLKDGKGLADLIDPTTGTAFRDNFVTVTDSDGCTRVSTPAADDWWGNSLAALPTGQAASQSLNTASRIYTLIPTAASSVGNGFEISANKVAVVTLGAAELSWDSSNVANCVGGNRSLICTNAVYTNLWIEGKFKGNTAAAAGFQETHLMEFNTLRFSRLHRVTIRDAQGLGIVFNTNGNNNYFSQVKVSNTGLGAAAEGIGLWGASDYNRLIDIEISNSSGAGLMFFGANNVIHRALFANNGSRAVYFNGAGSFNNIATQITVTSGDDQFGGAFFFTSADNNTINFASIANQMNYGIRLDTNAGGNLLAHTLVMNMGSYGVNIEGDSNEFYKVASAHTGDVAFNIPAGADSNEFHLGVWVGNNTGGPCTVAGANNFLDGACQYGANPPVTAATSTTLDLEDALVGKVTTDATNVDGATGSSLIGSISSDSWIGFDNLFRGWGLLHANDFPAANHRGRCTAGSCQVWDLRYSTTASALKNINGAFSTASCPASADSATAANVATDNNSVTANTFVLAAVEILNDYDSTGALIGDDDGLCESSEHCIFAPNLGSYLGHGSYASGGYVTCAGGNGVINYRLYGYATNQGSP